MIADKPLGRMIGDRTLARVIAGKPLKGAPWEVEVGAIGTSPSVSSAASPAAAAATDRGAPR